MSLHCHEIPSYKYSSIPRLGPTSSGSTRSRLADTDDRSDESEEGNTARGGGGGGAAAAAAAAGNINNEGRFDTTGWEKELSLEISRYEGQEDNLTYKPGPLDDRQLRKAAQEFHRRWEKEESRAQRLEAGEHLEEVEEDPLFVLVSRSCSKIPSDGMTRSALQNLEFDKLWYYLSDGDLFITKLASGPRHGAVVSKVVFGLETFAEQYVVGNDDPFSTNSDGKFTVIGGRKAPDAVLQRTYPLQPPGVPERLRAPFVVEVEVGHRGPKALMLQLEQYLQVPLSAYVLGIKIYKKQRHLPNDAFAAVAILWHKPPIPAAGGPPPAIVLEGVWNFGTADLHRSAKRAFCGLGPGADAGGLPLPVMGNFQYPAPNTVINVPAASLVTNQRVLYSDNLTPVPAGPTDLTINLAGVLRAAAKHN
jgi:hypothetical protein